MYLLCLGTAHTDSETTVYRTKQPFWFECGAVSRLVAGLSSQRPGFVPESVNVRFAVKKIATGQVFLGVLRFSPVSIIPPWLSLLMSPGG
jgi:hypothetical protein